jgi:hypothetical protein
MQYTKIEINRPSNMFRASGGEVFMVGARFVHEEGGGKGRTRRAVAI